MPVTVSMILKFNGQSLIPHANQMHLINATLPMFKRVEKVLLVNFGLKPALDPVPGIRRKGLLGLMLMVAVPGGGP